MLIVSTHCIARTWRKQRLLSRSYKSCTFTFQNKYQYFRNLTLLIESSWISWTKEGFLHSHIIYVLSCGAFKYTWWKCLTSLCTACKAFKQERHTLCVRVKTSLRSDNHKLQSQTAMVTNKGSTGIIKQKHSAKVTEKRAEKTWKLVSFSLPPIQLWTHSVELVRL